MQTPKKFNKSTSYILPMIGNHVSEFMGSNGPVKQFKNVFIADTDKPEFTEHIFLLYEFSTEQSYLLFEEKLKLNPYYIESYDPDYLHTMYIFGVPIEYKTEYGLYKQGKYSKFDNNYKTHIMHFHSIGINHPVMQTLTKAEERYQYWEKQLNVKIDRSAEVSSPPDMSLETYQDSFKAVKNAALKPSQEF